MDVNVEPLAPMRQIKIIPFKEKNDWELCPKYNIDQNNRKNNVKVYGFSGRRCQ